MFVQIKALKTLRDVVIEGEKVVLYGPNGAGKSAVIHLLLLALTKLSARRYYDGDALPGPALEGAEAVVKFGRFQVEIGGYNLSARRDDGSSWGSAVTSPDGWGQDLVVWHIDEVKARQVGAVRGCGTVFGGEEARFAGEPEQFVVRCPEVARRLYLEVYYDMARDPDLGWIPIRHLSYGQRRRLAIEAALETGDFVAVENFEVGLHVDYIADLLEKMEGARAPIVLETHSGLVVRGALRHGFSAYKVEGGRARAVANLADDLLFRREYEYYQLLV